MIDLSDGLAGDLRHILKAGGVGAELLKSAIPISRAAKVGSSRCDDRTAQRGVATKKSPFAAALTDGEDFELLFTVAGQRRGETAGRLEEKIPETEIELHRKNCRRRRTF